MHFPTNVSRLMALMCLSALFNKAKPSHKSYLNFCSRPESFWGALRARRGERGYSTQGL
jgi:hypothetical protein